MSERGNFLKGSVKRLLVPVDFSPKTTIALQHAAAIARFYGASVYLVHILDTVVFVGAGVPGVLNEIRSRCETALDEWADTIREHGVECTSLIREGDLDKQIAEVIAEYEIDILVLATKAGTDFGGFSIVSTAERILRKTMIPVLTVADCRPVRQWSGDGCLHVFYASDLTPESIRGLEYARAVQKRFCARFTIAHVLPKNASDEKNKAALEKAKALSGCDECEVAILHGSVAPAICEAASRMDADLITVGVKKHTFLREVLLGHTLLQILSGACCPVLTVRV